MMVSKPQQWITPMADAGVNLYTFHIEPVQECVTEICRKVREAGMQVGLALKPGTSVSYLNFCSKKIILISALYNLG